MQLYLHKTALFLLLYCTLVGIATPIFGQSQEKIVFVRAWDLYQADQYQASLQELQALPLSNGEGGPLTYHLLGLCQMTLDDYESAIASFNMALKKDPKAFENYFKRGQAFIALGRFDNATRDLELYLNKASKTDRKDKDFMISVAADYAYALRESGGPQKAIGYLERYRNKDERLYYLLAVYTLESSNDYQKAISYWEQALKIEPTDWHSLENIAISYYEVDDYDLAFLHIENLIKYYPNDGRGYYLKGVFLEAIGEDGDAMAWYEMAKEKGYDVDEAEGE